MGSQVMGYKDERLGFMFVKRCVGVLSATGLLYTAVLGMCKGPFIIKQKGFCFNYSFHYRMYDFIALYVWTAPLGNVSLNNATAIQILNLNYKH